MKITLDKYNEREGCYWATVEGEQNKMWVDIFVDHDIRKNMTVEERKSFTLSLEGKTIECEDVFPYTVLAMGVKWAKEEGGK